MVSQGINFLQVFKLYLYIIYYKELFQSGVQLNTNIHRYIQLSCTYPYLLVSVKSPCRNKLNCLFCVCVLCVFHVCVFCVCVCFMCVFCVCVCFVCVCEWGGGGGLVLVLDLRKILSYSYHENTQGAWWYKATHSEPRH